MEDFANDKINTLEIPKFETIAFTKLESDYWKVKLIYFVVTFCVLAVGLILATLNNENFYPYKYEIAFGFVFLFLIV